MRFTSLTFGSAALVAATPAAAASFASFFVEANFQGVSFGVSDFQCANFTTSFQNNIRSMAINDNYQCTLYSELGCKGNGPYYYYGDFKTFDGSRAKSVVCGPLRSQGENGLVGVAGI